MVESRFKHAVHQLVQQIPRGRVMTYGQIATLLGQPRAARAVGWTAHWGDPAVPWQRVVNRHGRLAPGWPGGIAGHKAALEADGVTVSADGYVALERYQWQPDQSEVTGLVGSADHLPL